MRHGRIWPYILCIKGTYNYLAEFQKTLKLTLKFFLNFLYDVRGILPEININTPCSFPPGVSQTWWNLTDLLKDLIDMFMKYLCVHHVVK